MRSLGAQRFWLGCDFFIAVIRGAIADRIYEKGGFNAIDKYDFRDWLELHGIHKITLPTPYCRTIYDAAFSYADGDPHNQQIAAGAAMRALFRMGFTYKGHAYYKMQAGMGDTVFEPIYKVLKARGVKFKFFHKVESLHLSPEPSDGSQRSVASIKILRQARMADGQPDDTYKPLRNIAETGPYMHNGSLKTLDDVVMFYYRGVPSTAPDGQSLDVEALVGQSFSEIPDLVAFLKSLTGETPVVQPPKLP